MIQYSEIQNKSVALLVWDAEKVKDIRVYRGKIIQKKRDRYFVNEAGKWQLRLDNKQFSRLKILAEEAKGDLMDADYVLSMSMSNLPENNPEYTLPPTISGRSKN